MFAIKSTLPAVQAEVDSVLSSNFYPIPQESSRDLSRYVLGFGVALGDLPNHESGQWPVGRIFTYKGTAHF